MAEFIREIEGTPVPLSRKQVEIALVEELGIRPTSDVMVPSVLGQLSISIPLEGPRPSYDEATQELVSEGYSKIDGMWTRTWSVRNLTQAEIDAKVEEEVSRATGIGDAEKALGLVLADMWLNIATGKFPPGVGPSQNQATQQQMQTARQQVRNRLEVYIRDLKGL